MTIRDEIYKVITEYFHPEKLEIIDESHKHAGHQGSHPDGESHFLIRVSQKPFMDKSRVEREKFLRRTIDKHIERELHAVRFEFI